MLDHFMPQLTRDLDMGTLEPNTPGVYVIPLEGDINIKITFSQEGGYQFQCPIVACPLQNKEGFVSRAMLANLFGQGTRDGILSLSDDGNMLTLTREVNYNSDYNFFKDALDDFITVVDLWRAEAKTHK